MKKTTLFVIFCTFIALLSLGYSATAHAKKRCKPFLEKLHNIQAMQRSGYSLKRGQSLRTKEDKARAKWWACEHSSLAKFKAQYGGGKKKAKKAKTRKKSTHKKAVKNKTYYSKMNKARSKSQKKVTTFNQSSAIVIKSKYQGNKKLAWLAFYQQPPQCKRPKSIAVFAYCSENKLQQQTEFENNYRN